MSAPTAELSQITFSPEEVFGHRPKDSFAALTHPDRNELRGSLLALEQDIAQIVDNKLEGVLHITPTTYKHPDYPDITLAAQARDSMDDKFQVTRIDITRGNDPKLLSAAAPIVNYTISALQDKGESLTMDMLVFEGGDCQITVGEQTVASEDPIVCSWGKTPLYRYAHNQVMLDTRDLANQVDLYTAMDESTDFGSLLLKMWGLIAGDLEQ